MPEKTANERFLQIQNNSSVEICARCRCWEWEAACGCKKKPCAHPNRKKLVRYYEIHLGFFNDEKLAGEKFIIPPQELLRLRLREPCRCRLRTRFRPVPVYSLSKKGNEKTFTINGFADGKN